MVATVECRIDAILKSKFPNANIFINMERDGLHVIVVDKIFHRKSLRDRMALVWNSLDTLPLYAEEGIRTLLPVTQSEYRKVKLKDI